MKSLSEDSGIAITVASYLTPNGNNIQGRGIIPDKILDFSEAKDFGSSEDNWVKDSQIYLNSLLDKDDENPIKELTEITSELKES